MKKTILLITLLPIIMGIYLWNQKNSFKSPTTVKSFADTDTLILTDSNKQYDTHLAQDKFGANKNAPIHYYMLALSWSPEFCSQHKKQNNNKISAKFKFQCTTQARNRWVIHGLWPQNNKARTIKQHPRFCQGDLPPLNKKIMDPYLKDSPGYALLQGQWEKHGSCAFDTAKSYFQQQQQLFAELILPNQQLNKQQLIKWIKVNNPKLKHTRIKSNKNELYICYDLQWKTINCP